MELQTEIIPSSISIQRKRQRSSIDICCVILNELSKAEQQIMRPTQLISKCGLASPTWKYCSRKLLNNELIKIIETKDYSRKAYYLTNRGLSIAQAYQVIILNLTR